MFRISGVISAGFVPLAGLKRRVLGVTRRPPGGSRDPVASAMFRSRNPPAKTPGSPPSLPASASSGATKS